MKKQWLNVQNKLLMANENLYMSKKRAVGWQPAGKGPTKSSFLNSSESFIGEYIRSSCVC